ncbi:MAG: hypothetical protein KAR11_06245 [Phycisphaerae bacterium]|nr:hypothetical protein [Phycisphaerae bacterium]
MKRTALLALLFLVQIGCVATPVSNELNYPVCQRLVNAKLVTVEVVCVNGCAPVDKSLQKAIDGFAKYVGGEVRTVQGKPLEVNADSNGLLKLKQLDPIIAKRRYRGASDIIIYFVSGLSDYKHRGHYTPLDDGGHVIVIQTQNVDNGTPPLTPREKWWELVIKHEFLHALSVPSNRTHSWSNRHCTHSDCILYPRSDARSIMTGILRLGPPMDLCKTCQNEVHQVQQAAGGKLIGPEEPYDYLKWLDELIKLNPKHPNVYTIRAREHARRNDLDIAISDLTKAIEVSKGSNLSYLCYLNRAGMFKMKGDAEAARCDLDKMTALVPNDAVVLNNLAWILSTHQDKWIRDSSYVIKLARRACELSKWKEAEFLDTLASAYAEAGQFDRAIEYQNKAIALTGVGKSEHYKQHMELYRNRTPCRDSGNSNN